MKKLAFALAAALAATPAGPASTPRLVEDAVVPWRAQIVGFGSYSGLALSADGARFIAVSDKGRFATGKLLRAGGRLTGVELSAEGPLLDPRGNPVARFDIDAEGLSLGRDGRIYVSFEANHRVMAYADLGKKAEELPRHKDFRGLQNNSGLEALFTGPDGALYAIPERSGKLERPFPVYRYADGDWHKAFTVPRRPPYLVTGADVGPDGRLYLLERDFRGLFGFATRIRRFSLSARELSDEEVLLESRVAAYDNLEGIAAWRDGTGAIRLTTISDDNQSLLQTTQFVEFVVRE